MWTEITGFNGLCQNYERKGKKDTKLGQGDIGEYETIERGDGEWIPSFIVHMYEILKSKE